MEQIHDKVARVKLMNEIFALKKQIFAINKVLKKDTKERIENVIIA